jgi:ABC-2 type transport system ATP-binding protein
MNALEVKGLSKRFGKLQAVNNISFDIPEGSVFGIIGRNGAGKTTTIRMMMGIYEKDSGEIFLRGKKIDSSFKDQVGYLPEERGLYKKMKVLDTLLFFAELKGFKGAPAKAKAMEYLERFSLADRKNAKIQDLSKGNQQKIQFIATVLHSPEFIILDEPFSGLDPVNTNILRDIMLELRRQGKIIIFSTHGMDLAEKMCDHLILIDKGELLLNGSIPEIKKEYSKSNISLVHEGDINFLKNKDYIEKIENFGNFTGIKVKSPNDIQSVLHELVANKIVVKKFDANDISLHEIFIEKVGE